MLKIKLVLQPGQFSSFTSWYLEPLWHDYFNIEIYDSTKSYDKRSLFVFWWENFDTTLANKLHSNGNKIVVDNLWETPDTKFNRYYQLSNPNWFWYNESLWWRSSGYHYYEPKKTYEKIALMPIRRQDATRDWIVENLGTVKQDMLWSYKNQCLPGDNYIVDGCDVDQRYMNPLWYDTTCIGLVVEAKQHETIYCVTEKTYKPCAYYQPLMILGLQNSLKFLKQQGFETFDNLWDESYDQEPVFEKRFSLILDNLKNFSKEPYSSETWQKLHYNHNHFFNETLCKQKIIKEIIEPLIHYAET